MNETTATRLRTLGDTYEEARQRLVSLVREVTSVDTDAVDTLTPACPGWRVRDVLAHLSGLTADIESGNLDGAGRDAWTAAQVDTRRSWPLEELLAEFDDRGPRLAALLDDFPGRYGVQVAADIAVHEQDIRGALQQPGARDSRSVQHCVNFLIDTIIRPGAAAIGVLPLEIAAGGRTAVVGSSRGGSNAPTEAIMAALASPWPPHDDEPPIAAGHARLSIDPFELMRAFTGRRSLAQVHQLDWTVDPEHYDALFGLWPFTPRPTDLLE